MADKHSQGKAFGQILAHCWLTSGSLLPLYRIEEVDTCPMGQFQIVGEDYKYRRDKDL